jgi:cystathionine beta-lyase/cystathionine gamma-synthase
LGIRVERATENAQEIAAFLESHPKVLRVFYPGLKSNQSHEIAKKQMSGFGTMLSFEHKGGGEGAEKFIDSLKLWYLATSLGGVESTVSYPFLSSHVGLSPEQLEALDVSPATVRLSVGIENVADLLADLKQALERS